MSKFPMNSKVFSSMHKLVCVCVCVCVCVGGCGCGCTCMRVCTCVCILLSEVFTGCKFHELLENMLFSRLLGQLFSKQSSSYNKQYVQ